jgi:hypothetical protein
MNASNATFFKVMKRSIDVVPGEQRLRDLWPKRKTFQVTVPPLY